MKAKKGSPKGKKKGMEYSVEMETEDLAEWNLPTPKNHLRQGKIYDDFCIMNQEFLKYILSCKLTRKEYDVLLFLLSWMDQQNKIIIDAEMIQHHLGIDKSNVNKLITKLEEDKIIYKRNLGYNKGKEILLNFDIISPHMAFKRKGDSEGVNDHKNLMRANEQPYSKQYNIAGQIDYINEETGEVFHTSPKK